MFTESLRRRLAAENSLSFSIKVLPRSSRTEWAGQTDDGSLKLRVHAVPEQGKANDEIIRFLASELLVPRACVEIVAGASGQRKQIRIRP